MLSEALHFTLARQSST